MPDRENVIAMAAKAGLQAAANYKHRGSFEAMTEPEKVEWLQLEAFAALLAAREREANALICDSLPAPLSCNVLERSLWDVATTVCADAIRARKEETP